MSQEKVIEQARKLKNDGNDYGKIRSYLNNAGYDNDQITSAFKAMDEEEVHELLMKQKMGQARIKLIGAVIITIIGLIYNIYRFGLSEPIDILFLLLPISILIVAFYSFRSIRNKRYTTSKIAHDNQSDRE